MITPEDLDLLRNPDRIFHALLEFTTVPAEQKAFLRRAREKLQQKNMSRALYSRVLEIAFEFGVFNQDMRPYIGEVSPTDQVRHVPEFDEACSCGHPKRVHLRQAWTCMSGGDCGCEKFKSKEIKSA